MLRTLLIASFVLLLPLNALAEEEGVTDPYCFNEAGVSYGVSSKILWAISRHESRHNPYAVHQNKNGTYDYCHMQINSSWARVLGSQSWSGLSNPCHCTKVGAWVLAGCIKRHGYSWEAIGCYNASSPDKRLAYGRQIYRTMNVWGLL